VLYLLLSKQSNNNE